MGEKEWGKRRGGKGEGKVHSAESHETRGISGDSAFRANPLNPGLAPICFDTHQSAQKPHWLFAPVVHWLVRDYAREAGFSDRQRWRKHRRL